MEKETMLGMFSAAAAVIAAIVAWLQATRVAKIKIDHDRRKKAFELATQETLPIENAISEAWTDIQIIKEGLTKLTSDFPCEFDEELKQLEQSCNRIINDFSIWGSKIPKMAEMAWHRSKNISYEIKAYVATIRDNYSSNVYIDKDIKNTLAEIRNFLTEQQVIFSSAKQGLRAEIVNNIMKLI